MNNKKFILAADDFGLTKEINQGVKRAIESGVVTYVSLMVSAKETPTAVNIAKENPELTVGLHVEADHVLGISGNVWSAEGLRSLMESAKERSIIKKVMRVSEDEIKKFLDMGFEPTVINSHMNIHFFPTIFPHFVELSARYSFKYMRFSPHDPLLEYTDIPVRKELGWMEQMLKGAGIGYSDWYIASSFHFFPPELKEGTTEIMFHAADLGPGDVPYVYYLDLVKILTWGAYYRNL